MALINKLSAIGDAIREKTGKEDLLTLDQMPEEIKGISGGGGGDLPEEAFNLSGRGDYRFAYDYWNWFIENYGNKINTSNLTSVNSMFYNSKELTRISFNINIYSQSMNSSKMFYCCNNLLEIPIINGLHSNGLSEMFLECYKIKEIPEKVYETWEVYSGNHSGMCRSCYSLRKLPIGLYNKFKNKTSTYIYSFYFNMARSCYVLDEILNLPVISASTWTSNAFSYSFYQTNRLKNLTFAMNRDNTPVAVRWKSQIIDLSTYVGYGPQTANLLSYNDDIKVAKRVYDDTTYQALKNDPDWWSVDIAYSRYNHDSAVATINSLPDASAYLATTSGTNTIKFTGEAGSLTDGGAINTLTEEEIAVATNKGWTITFV